MQVENFSISSKVTLFNVDTFTRSRGCPPKTSFTVANYKISLFKLRQIK